MSASRLRALVVLVLAVVASVGALIWTPSVFMSEQRPKFELATLFPRAFAEWVEDDRMPAQLVSPDQQAVLNRIYNQTLSRTYVNRVGQRVMLSVAYGGDQSDGTRAHRPEVCYPAQGFQILSQSRGSIQLGDHSVPVRQLVAKQGGRIEPITYWVVVGDRIANSGTEQKLAQLTYSTRGVIPDGMLVRVSTIDGDVKRSYQVQEQFLKDMAGALSMQQRSRVIGGSSPDVRAAAGAS